MPSEFHEWDKLKIEGMNDFHYDFDVKCFSSSGSSSNMVGEQKRSRKKEKETNNIMFIYSYVINSWVWGCGSCWFACLPAIRSKDVATIENKWWHYSDLMFALIASIPNDVEVVAIHTHIHTRAHSVVAFCFGWLTDLTCRSISWSVDFTWKMKIRSTQKLDYSWEYFTARSAQAVLTPKTMQQLCPSAHINVHNNKSSNSSTQILGVNTERHSTRRHAANCANNNSKMANKTPP